MTTPILQPQQTQSLMMTQQLRQSIELLQFSSQDLQEFVSDQVLQNPLLSQDDGIARAEGEDYQNNMIDESSVSSLTQAQDMRDEQCWGENSLRYDHARSTHASSAFQQSSYDVDAFVAEDITLQEHIYAQLRCGLTNEKELAIAYAVVDQIDAAGYLPANIHEILGVSVKRIAPVIHAIHQCDPVGIGARSLHECLALQLKDRGQYSHAMEQLLDNMEMIASGDIKKLAVRCGVMLEELPGMLQTVRRCNPKPALSYDHQPVQTFLPDVLVTKLPDERWHVALNQDAQPKVLMDKTYTATIKNRVRCSDEKKIINDHAQHAHWLTKALNQRSTTLLNVATEIVRQQEDFFAYGIEYLKPMTLRDIAEACECHESTVSRITTQKYLRCERGVFELKFFFSAMLQNSNGGEDYSSRSVKEQIRQLIDGESPKKILSDDAIAKYLQQRGVNVARRTVVKYRTALNIPSSVERRRTKKMMAV